MSEHRVLIAIVASMCRGNEAREDRIVAEPRSHQYYLPSRESDNLIDARATLGLVVGIALSHESRRRQIMQRLEQFVGLAAGNLYAIK